MVVEGGGVGLFGHLGATTGFIIGHADDRVVHDTWRDHPTGFGTPDRSRCPSPFPQFFFLPRNAGAAPPPPPPLPVTRSQRRNKTLARFCFGPPPTSRSPSSSFSFLSLATPPPSLRPFFFYRCAGGGELDDRVPFFSFFFYARERSASNELLLLSSSSSSSLEFSPSCFVLSLCRNRSVLYRAALDREKRGYDTRQIGWKTAGDRHSAYPRRDAAAWKSAGSNFRWLDGSRDTRTENTKPCCLGTMAIFR